MRMIEFSSTLAEHIYELRFGEEVALSNRSSLCHDTDGCVDCGLNTAGSDITYASSMSIGQNWVSGECTNPFRPYLQCLLPENEVD